ncbi:MAG: U32 family peptidase [Desulfobulbaceae bacterium]|nr:U32 family peptidase [Desulfobulbaceae bacterium]
MEILAPVGNFPAFEAALEEGADAVYLGAPGLNARSLAKDFSLGEIGTILDAAREAGVKTYIAMNSLVKEEEIGTAVESLEVFSRLKPDALIIQDFGLHYLARTYFPNLELHASTLMSVHNSHIANQLAGLGFSRVVLARELTLEEIGSIARATKVELEIFIHGAMCFSFSGLCLFSSMHGGKSSLRGQCVQPCRRNYQWSDPKGRGRETSHQGFPFSMNDLSGIEVLSQLRAIGVKCLKIEGRLKNAEYVRKTVRGYRLALSLLDKSDEKRREGFKEVEALLDEAMGRRRASGFFLSPTPEQAVSPMVSGTSGLPVGEVRGFRDGILNVHLSRRVSRDDRFRFHGRSPGERVGFAPRSLFVNGREVNHAGPDEVVAMEVRSDSFAEVSERAEGTLYRVDVGTRKEAYHREKKFKERRTPKGATPDKQRVGEVLRDLFGNTVVPSFNPPRGKKREKVHGRGAGGIGGAAWVKVRSLADTSMLLPLRPAKFIVELGRRDKGQRPSGKWRKKQVPVVWSLPPIIFERDLQHYSQRIKQLVAEGYTEFQLGHIGQRALFLSSSGKMVQGLTLYGDYTLNILNSLALRSVRDLGISGAQFSPETDRDNMRAALAGVRASGKRHGLLTVGILCYGRPPLFTARLTGPHLTSGTRFKSPKGEAFVLESHDHLTKVRSVHPFSLLDYQNELRENGIDYFVVDITEGNPKRESSLLAELLKSSSGKRHVLTGNFPGKLL